MTSKPTATNPAAPPTESSTVPFEAGFDEDDEFEEFEEDDWAMNTESTTAAVEVEWEDDWDDDLVEGDFVQQLRQELVASANILKQ